MRNKRLLVPILAFVHYMAAHVFVLMSFSASMRHFDDGTSLTHSERLISNIADTLMFPLYGVSMKIGLGWLRPLHSLLTILNSFIWAIALYGLAALFLKIKNKGKRPTSL